MLTWSGQMNQATHEHKHCLKTGNISVGLDLVLDIFVTSLSGFYSITIIIRLQEFKTSPILHNMATKHETLFC